MASTRGANTMAEELRGVLSQVAQMKAAPDADIAYLTNLETQILRYLRAPFEKQRMEAQLGGPQAAGAQAAAGASPGPGPAEMLLFGAQPQQRVPGVMQAPNMTAGADELRRLLSQSAL